MLSTMDSRLKAGVVLGLFALGAALAVWLWRPPSGAVAAPALQAVHLPPKPHAEPLDEIGGSEDAPLMPVGTKELPEQLDRRQLEAAMAKVKIDKCKIADEPPFAGTLTVRVTIAKSGNVQSVAVLPPADTSATGACVAKQIRREAAFPAFRGTLLPTIELTYPFLF
jgi:hypothetical protein